MANQKLPDGQKIPTLAGERWRTMSDKEKEPYLKQEAKEKAKYEEAMKEYRKKVKFTLEITGETICFSLQ